LSDAQSHCTDSGTQQTSTSYSVQGEDSQVNVKVRFSTQIKGYMNRCFCAVGVVCSLQSFLVGTNCNLHIFLFVPEGRLYIAV
jgi:hypothetical protein